MKYPAACSMLVPTAVLVLAASSGAQDGGVVKWVKSLGGTGLDVAYDALALSDGGVIVTGEFWGEVTFGSTTLTSLGEADLFVVRLSALGTVVWAKRGGGPYSDRGLRLRLDPGGDVLVDGTAFGPMTFGLTSGEPSFVRETAFDAEYSLPSGTCLSVTADASRLMDVPRRKGEFSAGQGFIESGMFDLALPLQGTGDLLGAGSAGSSADGYLAEYERVSNALSLTWAVSLGGPDADRANAVSILPAEAACIVVGTYRDQAQFQTKSGSAITRTSAGDNDIFVARYTLDDDDSDGLSNLQETSIGSSSSLDDTDDDGFWDVLEVLASSQPTDPDDAPLNMDGAFTALGTSLSFDANGGIPDSDELALLCALLAPDPPSCSIHASVRTAFATNVARMYVDTATKVTPNALRMLLAAYMTLGDSQSISAVQSALSIYGVSISSSNYDISRATFLSRTGDADGDQVTNEQEHASSSNRAMYLGKALDASDGGQVVLFQNGENGSTGWCWSSSTWDLVADPAGLYGTSWHCGDSDTRLSSPTVNTTGFTSLEISIRYRDVGIDSNDTVYVEIQTLTAGQLAWDLTTTINAHVGSDNTWYVKTVTLTNQRYFHSAFKLRFDGTSLDSGEDLWIDDVVVRGF